MAFRRGPAAFRCRQQPAASWSSFKRGDGPSRGARSHTKRPQCGDITPRPVWSVSRRKTRLLMTAPHYCTPERINPSRLSASFFLSGAVIVLIHALARKRLPPPNMAPTPHLNGRNRTILVVEDEAEIRHVLQLHKALKRMGHVVLEARDGAEGLTVSRKFNEQIDLVITDVRMPRMDGPTMVRHLQAERPSIRVLLISGYSAESVPNDLMKDFLHKPFLPAAIEQRFRRYWAARRRFRR